MGAFASCCKPSATDITPDVETRRRQQTEAAERRAAAEAARGVRDPKRVKLQQEKQDQMERREQELAAAGGATLKWTSN